MTTQPAAPRKGMSLARRQAIWAWAFLALPVAFYALIRFYPTAQAFWLSLTDWDLMSKPEFIGLENYREMFADPVFWKVFKNTFLYLIIGMPSLPSVVMTSSPFSPSGSTSSVSGSMIST